MNEEIKCYLVEPTGFEYRSLRRYRSGAEYDCKGALSYHNAHYHLGKFAVADKRDVPPYDDPRWPTKCETCDYVFTEHDAFQLFNDAVWVRQDSGEEMSLRNAKPGAMWYAFWMESAGFAKGPDGRILIVKTPGGDWNVDSRATNCTMPNDDEHRCWIRSGVPPKVTVNKHGFTCLAGGGSIQARDYHGTLTNGVLRRC